MVTVGIWNRQRTMDEEFLSSDNQTFNAKLGLVGDVYVRAGDHITDPRIADREAIAILEDNATALLGMTTATAEC
jgi:hypothetical protein